MAKILVVDDRTANREYLVTLLGYGNHQLLEAADGAEALELARMERPDLVITDILMPTMDGYEFVRQLRADPTVAQTQVIFFTAHYHEREARSLADACGVSHILYKPCEPEDVLRTVEAALNLDTPVVSEGALIGEEFDRKHLRVMTDKLSQKANELRAVNMQLNALIEINLQLASEMHPHRLFEILCRAAREIVGARYAAIEVTGQSGQSLREFFISGMDAETAASLVRPQEPSPVVNSLLAESGSIRLRDLSGDPQAALLPPYRPPVSSFVGASIASPDRIYGWICLTDKLGAEEFSEKDEQIVSILASLAGRVYENRRLYAEVRHRSIELEQEVIERRRAEEALRASEQLFRAVFDGALEAMLIADDEGRYLDANPAACAIFGLSKDELTGRSIIEFMETDFDFAGAWGSFLDQGWQTGEFRLARPDKTMRDLEFSATARILPGRHLSVLRDITERKQLEEQLKQSQKMEAIGRLAGGIAHDFNNLLTAIIGYSQLVMGRLEDSPLRREIEEIQKAGARAAALTSQLLIFSRRQILQLRILDLNTIVTEMEKMLRRMIGEDVQLITHLEPSPWHVKADPGQIAQVIMNLAVNARDAMPRGGKLIIETSNVLLDEAYTSQHLDVAAGRYVLLAVSDSGTGMDEDTLSHLFEPFFTTKEPGKGTGLGLSTVYGIVKQSGGHIWAYSEPGQGATFKIYLPRAEALDEAEQEREEIFAPPSGTETVLIVEDEEVLRLLATKILTMHGYKVLEASNGEEALKISQKYSEPIHLLLTDVIMPQMSGPDLSARIAALRPEIRMLFMSGYTDRAIMHNSMLDKRAAYIQKPFTPSSLARKVREVLDM